ncbi:MAG: hypothetical protein QM740_20505 [Acidovorax sp.]
MNKELRRATSGSLVPVRDTQDIDFRIKESELVTGIAGRTFVVFGSPVESYRIELRPCGYLVDPLDGHGCRTGAHYVSAAEWAGHSLARALRVGLVFTFEAGL